MKYFNPYKENFPYEFFVLPNWASSKANKKRKN